MSGDTLGNLQLTWYNNIDPEETVEIVNTLWQRANAGETVFYDIYTEEEKAEDPAKEDTGLFFFRGDPGAKSPTVTLSGAVPPEGVWRPGWGPMVRRPLAGTNCPDLGPLSCSIPVIAITQKMTRQPLPV